MSDDRNSVAAPSGPGSHPSDQAPAGLGASRFDPSRETPFERTRHLRYVPPVEGDGATRRHWIIVHEPGCIPEKKGSFKQEQLVGFLRELVACRPEGTRYTVISLTWDFDLWVQSGHELLIEEEVWGSISDSDEHPESSHV